MASYFVGSSPFLSHPLTTRANNSNNQFSSSSSQSPAPPQQPNQRASQQPSQIPPPASLNSASLEQPPVSAAPLRTEREKPAASKRTVESTDWVASSLTRRFGLGAGLAWVGFLAVGVVSEQIKTRFEVSEQEANTRDVEEEKEVQLPNGLRYYELRVGGGATPRVGDLVVIGLRGVVKETGQVFVDTYGDQKKPLALVMGSRPYTRGMCEGIEYTLRDMKAGGKRRVIVPPSLGFKDNGADFGSGVEVPPNATLEYVVEVDRVSVAPA